MVNQIPDVVVLRLPIYIRALAHLEEKGIETISSQELGEHLRVTPAQIRKDLSYFGKFGKQGRGYNIKHLLTQLRRILGLDREWKMILVGVGRLGHAIAGYEGFAAHGFHIAAAFDTDPEIVGTRVGELEVKNVSELINTAREEKEQIAILAVPASKAQEVTDVLVQAGTRAILNYVPIALRVPRGVWVREIDPVAALQSMTYYLNIPKKATMSKSTSGRKKVAVSS